MADTPNNLFEKEMALVKMWMDGEVEFGDLPADVQDALTEVFSEEPSEEPMEVAEPVIEEQFVKQEAVQHLDLLHKANDEHRFTLGPWYIPNRYDAHGEWTDANEFKALYGIMSRAVTVISGCNTTRTLLQASGWRQCRFLSL
jgi:hypothetical protein